MRPGDRFHRQNWDTQSPTNDQRYCCTYVHTYAFACSGRCSRGRSGVGASCHASSAWGLGCLGGPAFFFVGIAPGPAADQQPGGYSAAGHSRPRGGSKDITAVGGWGREGDTVLYVLRRRETEEIDRAWLGGLGELVAKRCVMCVVATRLTRGLHQKGGKKKTSCSTRRGESSFRVS